MLGKIFSSRHFELFFSFFPENKIRCLVQIVSKGKCYFLRKNKKKISNLASAELAQIDIKGNLISGTNAFNLHSRLNKTN